MSILLKDWVYGRLVRGLKKIMGGKPRNRIERRLLALEILENRLNPSGEILTPFGAVEFQSATAGTTVNGITNLQGSSTSPILLGFNTSNFVGLLEIDGNVTLDNTNPNDPVFTANGPVQTDFPGISQGVTLFNNPGQKFDVNQLVNNGLSALNGSSFSVAGATFAFNQIQLATVGGQPQLNLQGAISLAGLQLAVNGSNQVIINSNGVSLTGVAGTLTGSVSVGGLSLNANQLSVAYASSNSSFSFSGQTSFSLGGNSLSGSLGTVTNPGLVITNGSVQSLNVDLTSNITVGGVNFTADDLVLTYQPNSQGNSSSFTITGNASFSLNNSVITVQMGAGTTDGIVFTGGSLVSMDMGITGSLTVGGMTFTANSLSMAYTASQSGTGSGNFVIGGTASLALGNNSASVTFNSTNGLVISQGTVTTVNASVSGTLVVGGVSLTTTGLAMNYNNSTSTLGLSGTAGFKLGQDSLTVTIPSTPNPGLLFQQGVIASVNGSVTGTIHAGGLTFSATKLGINYSGSPSSVTITGGASFSLGSDILTVNMGGNNSQGLVINNGALASLNGSVTGTIHAGGLTFSANTLAINYTASPGNLSITGGASFALGSDTLSINLGGKGNKGLAITNGSVASINGSISGAIHAGGLTFTATTLALNYTASSSNLAIAGGVSFALGSDNLTANLGSTTTPGIVVSKGFIASINGTVNGTIHAGGLTFTANTLAINYTASPNSLTITGGASFALGSDTLNVTLGGTNGTSGLVINQGALTSINGAVSGTIHAGGLTFTASTLAINYTASPSSLTITGGASVALGTDTLNVTLGGSSGTSGLVINQGTLTSINGTVNGNIHAGGLTFTPSTLAINYTASPSSLTITGGASVALGTDTLNVTLGGSNGTSGLVINQGALTSLNGNLSGTIHAGGLAFTTNNLAINYTASPSSLTITGGATFALGNDTLNVTLGGSNGTSGLVINQGALTSLNGNLSGTIHAGGLAFTANSLAINYTASPSSLIITGGASFALGNDTLNVTLGGTSGTTGMVINQGALTSINGSVSGTINAGSLTFTANTLAINYTASPSSLTITGGASFALGTDTLNVTLGGSNGTSGLVINQGTLTSINGSISGTIHAGSLTFTASTLALNYTASTSSMIITGGAGFTLGSDSLNINFGNQGLVINQGVVASINASLSGSFHVGSLTVNANSLTLNYNSSPSTLSVVGNTSFTLGNDSLGITFAGQGLVINQGFISSVNAAITGTIHAGGLAVTANNLSLIYVAPTATSNSSSLTITGGTTFSLGNDSVSVQFGNQGLVISNGVVSSINASLSGSFHVGSLTVSASNLTLAYLASTSTLSITGGTTFALGNDSLGITFASQGLVISNGAISSLNAGITGTIHAGGLTFTANTLSINYTASPASLAITGGAGFTLGSDSLTITFGSQGLVINQGSVASINASVTGSFHVGSLTVSANSLGLNYIASTATTPYSLGITGGASLAIGSDTLAITFGANGMVINNGSITSVNVSVSGNFSLGGLTFTASNLNFLYSSTTNTLGMNGSLGFSLEGSSLTVNLIPSGTTPGLLISNGVIQSVDASFTGNLSLFGCTIIATGLNFDYQSSPSQFSMGGSIGFSNSDGTFKGITATLGTATDPGLVISNGSVTQLNIGITGSFNLFGLDVTANNFTVAYDSDNDQLNLNGGLQVTDLFSASVTLTNGGVTINTTTGAINIDGVTLNLSNVNLGAFTIQNFTLTYTQSGGSTTFSAGLMVAFPLGWAVGGSLEFVNGELNDISLSYSSNTGIPIGATGLYVTSISASIDNLIQPDNLDVSGSITLTYGKTISIGSNNYSILTATGSFSVDASGLTINANVQFFGGLLGSGSGSLDLDWATGQYSLSVNASLFDNTFTFSGSVQFDSTGDLLIQATASVNIPDAVPIIGGDNLGSISFAFLYNYNNGNPTGFAAAWTSIHLWLLGDYSVGFEYDLNKGFSLLGSSGISSVENSLTLPSPPPTSGQGNSNGSGNTNSTQLNWTPINNIPVRSGQSNGQGSAFTIPSGVTTVNMTANISYAWTQLALVQNFSGNNAQTEYFDLVNFQVGQTELVDLNGGNLTLFNKPTLPLTNATVSPIANSGGTSFNIYSNGVLVGTLTNDSNPAWAYITVTGATTAVDNVVIQAATQLGTSVLPTATLYLETYASLGTNYTTPAVNSSSNSFVYTQPTISAVSNGPAPIPAPQVDTSIGNVYLDNDQSFNSSALPQSLTYYATNTTNFLTPLLFSVNNGVYTLCAIGPAFQAVSIGVNTANLTWNNWIGGASGPAPGTTYIFGFTDQKLNSGNNNSVTSASATSGTIPFSFGNGQWMNTVNNSLVTPSLGQTYSISGSNGATSLNSGRTYSAYVQSGGVGDPAIPRNNTDQNQGEVYIDNAGMFTSSSLPQTFTFYAGNTNNFITPLLFSVVNGTYSLEAIGQSIKPAQNGVNTGQLVWSQWNPTTGGPIIGVNYVLGFSDRDVTISNGQPQQTTTSGTIPFDYTNNDFLYTINPNPFGALSFPMVFSTNPGGNQLFTGRTYSVNVFPAAATAGSITVSGSISPSLANETTVNFYATSTSAGATGGTLVSTNTILNNGLIVDNQGFFTANLNISSLNNLPPGTNYFYAVVNDGTNPIVTSGVSGAVTNGVTPAVTGKILDTTGAPVTGATVSILLGNNQSGNQIQTVGAPTVSRANLDTDPGQVYIMTTGSFTSPALPGVMNFYANSTSNYLTPILFSLNNGIYSIVAVGQSIQPTQLGVNSIPLIWGNLSNLNGSNYYFGYSDRLVNLSGNTVTTDSTTIGTIPWDTTGNTWLCSATGVASSPSLSIGATFSTNGNNGSIQLQSGRIYSVSIATINVIANIIATTDINGNYSYTRPAGLPSQVYTVQTLLTLPNGYTLPSGQNQGSQVSWSGLPGTSATVNYTLVPPAMVSGTITDPPPGLNPVKTPLNHVRVFEDLNNNGKWEPGEPYTYSTRYGSYNLRLDEFAAHAARAKIPYKLVGNHLIRVETPSGYTLAPAKLKKTVALKNSHHHVNGVGFDFNPLHTQAPTSKITSPAKGTVNGLKWIGIISGTASDGDGNSDIASVRVSIFDQTDHTYWYVASAAVKANKNLTSNSFVASATPIYLTAKGTGNWSLDVPQLAPVNGHTYLVTSQAVDKEGHFQKTLSKKIFTYRNNAGVPTLDLKPSTKTGSVGTPIVFTGTIATLFVGQPTWTGVIQLIIDGKTNSVKIENGIANFSRALSKGKHTIFATYSGDKFVGALTSKTIVVVVS